jgi:hypothetical protein
LKPPNPKAAFLVVFVQKGQFLAIFAKKLVTLL